MAESWGWPRATVVDHYDGDTFYADIDLGMELFRRRMPIRLFGIDAPEMRRAGQKGPDKGAVEAKAKLVELCPLGSTVSLDSVGYDKYGPRIDAVVTTSAGLNVNSEMVISGHAVRKDY